MSKGIKFSKCQCDDKQFSSLVGAIGTLKSRYILSCGLMGHIKQPSEMVMVLWFMKLESRSTGTRRRAEVELPLTEPRLELRITGTRISQFLMILS